MSCLRQTSDDLIERARRSGMSGAEISDWRKRLDSARLDLCGCRPAAVALVLSAIASVVMIVSFVEQRYVSAIAVAALATIVLTIGAKFLGYRSADRRLAELQETLRSAISRI